MYDDFSAVVLDTDKWDAVKTFFPGYDHGGSADVENGKLRLHAPVYGGGGDYAAHAGIRVRAKSAIRVSGIATYQFKWRPSLRYTADGGYRVWVAVGPAIAQNTRWLPYYPAILLSSVGHQDSVKRTRLSVGTFEPTYFSEYEGGVAQHIDGQWFYSTEYAITWVINWTERQMSVYIDGDLIVNNLQLPANHPTVTPPWYFYIGSTTATSASIDYFDDVILTLAD